MVEPGARKGTVAEKAGKVHDLVRWPAQDESTTDDHWCHGTSFVCVDSCRTRNLKIISKLATPLSKQHYESLCAIKVVPYSIYKRWVRSWSPQSLLFRQSARRWQVIIPAVSCHCFPPGPRLHSQQSRILLVGARGQHVDGSSLIIHWSSGSHKRSTNWANHHSVAR